MPLKGPGESECMVDGAKPGIDSRDEVKHSETKRRCREVDVDGRPSVTKDEERMLRGGCTVMRFRVT